MKHQITIDIDDHALAGYTDEYLAMCWQVAQHNPAPFGDYPAGDLTEHISREIVRRWLRGVRPELWNHQAKDCYWNDLRRFAKYEPGNPADDPAAFHSGRWVPRQDNSSGTGTIAVSQADLQAVTRALADHEWSDFADEDTEAAYRRLAAEADAS